MTREQIETWLHSTQDGRDVTLTHADSVAVFRLAILGAEVLEAFSFSGSAPFEFGKIVDAVRGTVSGPLWDAVCDVRDAIDANSFQEEAER